MGESNSTEPTADPRSQRGLALAKAKRDSIKLIVGTKYLVPSATGSGGYVVETQREQESCTCLDFSKLGGNGGHRCKHLWACIHVKELPDGSALIVEEPPKKAYKRHCGWETINACRTLIPELGPILLVEAIDCLGLPPPQGGKRGAPPISDRDKLVVAALRTWDATTAHKAVVTAGKYLGLGLKRVPKYNTLLDSFAHPLRADGTPAALSMPNLHRLLAITALPSLPLEEDWAIDGSAFGSSRYDCAHTEKHGPKEQRRPPTKKHRWVNAILVYGRKTHVIVAAQITEQHVSETPCMPELLRRAIANGARIRDWCGDGAYMADYNVAAVEAAGGRPYFKWPEGVTGKTKPAIARLHKTFEADADLYWERYDRTRPLAETGNQMLKERCGHYLRSRKPEAQYAECMLRCICHNVACLVMAVKEFQVPRRYWLPDPSILPNFGSIAP